ncbi:hypothetical protein [Amycolatopsis suaedae]|uniref:Uncharacterized protein n=1 Tax=Amycolatopsis suaedae TaxID=2510978 RepID=A0A4Q7J1C9_9PSEU|nr:hypothetical protein [Amycolatopsis suaedae]RZQ60246.1 hypothetical protein EWH70_30135 [Amycolatopsis suaedae]
MAIPKEDQQLDGVGTSAFHVTQLTTFQVERPDMNFKKELNIQSDPIVATVDWAWRQFNLGGGGGFLESLVEPLSGNYLSIEVNGVVWQKVGTMFAQFAGNLGGNLTKLVAAELWDGPAAEAMQRFVETYWTRGAALVGGKVCEFIGSGFARIGDLARTIATAAANQIVNIFRMVRDLVVKRLIPGVGWVRTLFEYVADIFTDVKTLHENLEEVFAAFRKLSQLRDSMSLLVDAARAYLDTLVEFKDAVAKIPSVGTLEQVQQSYGEITSKGAGLNTKFSDLENRSKDVVGKADDITKTIRSRTG